MKFKLNKKGEMTSELWVRRDLSVDDVVMVVALMIRDGKPVFTSTVKEACKDYLTKFGSLLFTEFDPPEEFRLTAQKAVTEMFDVSFPKFPLYEDGVEEEVA